LYFSKYGIFAKHLLHLFQTGFSSQVQDISKGLKMYISKKVYGAKFSLT
jgi:hypothetical protein